MGMFNIFSGLFKKKGTFQIDKIVEELEEALITADVGFETSQEIIRIIRKKKSLSYEDLRTNLNGVITALFQDVPIPIDMMEMTGMSIIMMIGVNGTGKTTTLAKMAHILKRKGKKVIIAAGDTFRAAAIEQLQEWCHRLDIPLIKQKQFADSSSVIFDAISSGEAQKADYILIDTAGRMHTNDDLIRELEKMDRTILKKIHEKSFFRILVIDSQTGQNSFQQVQKFSSLFKIHGIVLTKVDSGFKAGMVLRIIRELKIPILFKTTGESINDILPFNPAEYIRTLF